MADIARPPWIDDLFAAIDRRDADAFAAFLTEDGRFRWGSRPVVEGRQAVRDFVAGFFADFEALSHRLTGTWDVPQRDALFVEGEVTYTLPGGARVSVPFLNRFRLDGDRVAEYLIYADPTPLTEAADG